MAIVFGAPKLADAQVMLIGCTANTGMNTPPSDIVDINHATGAASNPRPTGIFLIGGLATEPTTGQVFGLTTFASTPASTLIRVNPETGLWSTEGSTGLPNIVEGDLSFNPLNGFLYGIQDFGVGFNQRNLFRINPLTGLATVVGSLGSSGDYSALSFDAAGTLFAIETSGTNSHLVVVDPNSAGILNTITMNINLGGAAGLAFHPLSGQAYVADGSIDGSGILYSLNTTDGFAIAIGSLGVPGGIAGLTFISVPEPSSISMILFPGIVWILRLRPFIARFWRTAQ